MVKKYTKSDRYPKYLYVIYDGAIPVYVGVTAYPVEHRFSGLYRSEFIMKNKDRLCIRIVDTILDHTQLVKEKELIFYFLEKGYTLENKVYTEGAGIATGSKKSYRRLGLDEKGKLNGLSRRESYIRKVEAEGKEYHSYEKKRKARIEQIKILLNSGLSLYKISKELDIDYGNLYKFVKKYIN